MLKRILVAAAVMIAACATPSQPGTGAGVKPAIQVESGQAFDIGVGQEAHVKGTAITVRLVRVSDDSRCPVDVQCVWAGNAVARLALSAGDGSGHEVAINTTTDPRSTIFSGYRITLVGLKPAPRSGTTIKPSDYVATLEVTRL
jgi:hypothetical protein